MIILLLIQYFGPRPLYDNFTLNSIFQPKALGGNIELRVELSYVKQLSTEEVITASMIPFTPTK